MRTAANVATPPQDASLQHPMFQTTRRRLALWYTTITAILLLLFASGFYFYVRSTLIERIDDTLNHVVEVVRRSLVIEKAGNGELRINVDSSFRDNAESVEDDHIDLEWFSPTGELLWSTFSQPPSIPLRPSSGETVHVTSDQVLRQVTQRVEQGRQVVGYLRVSHPWFEVTKPARQLIVELSAWSIAMVSVVASIGWFLSGLAMAPVRDSYQRLKQFTADASHELRNPIAVIQTNVQVALADPNPDPQLQQQQLRVVERLTRRLGRLVDDLLFLARQDSGMIQMKHDCLSLDHLLEEVIEEQDAIAAEKSVYLTLSIPASIGDWHTLGDRDQLIRLFTNLISNAIQYTSAEGKVNVSLQSSRITGQNAHQIQISDTGVGIPEDALPYVFDRFYRVDPARSRAVSQATSSASGSGLGLAIAKVIVENHRGSIRVESHSNQGTIVTLTLPPAETVA